MENSSNTMATNTVSTLSLSNAYGSINGNNAFGGNEDFVHRSSEGNHGNSSQSEIDQCKENSTDGPESDTIREQKVLSSPLSENIPATDYSPHEQDTGCLDKPWRFELSTEHPSSIIKENNSTNLARVAEEPKHEKTTPKEDQSDENGVFTHSQSDDNNDQLSSQSNGSLQMNASMTSQQQDESENQHTSTKQKKEDTHSMSDNSSSVANGDYSPALQSSVTIEKGEGEEKIEISHFTFHAGKTPTESNEVYQEEDQIGPLPSVPKQAVSSQLSMSCPATPAPLESSIQPQAQTERRRSAAELKSDNVVDSRNMASPDIIVSRRGTVVGKRGSISDLRKRFATLQSDAKTSTSNQIYRQKTRSNTIATVRSQNSIPPSHITTASSDDDKSRRRQSTSAGTPPKGVVGRFRSFFLKKASESKEKPLPVILQEKEEAEAEKLGGKIVIYTTSTSTVKETYWNCQKVLKILHGLMAQYEERDITLHREYKRELSERLPGAAVPQVFLNGQHLGDIDAIVKLNENEQLAPKLAKVPRRKVANEYSCEVCGDRRFVLCTWCGGDKKSMMSRFGKELVKLKCTACNEHGLMKCPECVYGGGMESTA